MVPCIEICCIQSVQETRLAIRYGAIAIGLVFIIPSGIGPIAEELIDRIAEVVHPGGYFIAQRN